MVRSFDARKESCGGGALIGNEATKILADWNSLSAQLQGSFLDRHIRRTNRNLLITSVLLVTSVASYGVLAVLLQLRRGAYNG